MQAKSHTSCYLGALFDLDGTLWNSNPIHAAAFERVCLEHGLAPLPYENLAGLDTASAFAAILSETDPLRSKHLDYLVREKQRMFRQQAAKIVGEESALIEFFAERRTIRRALVTSASSPTAEIFLARLPQGFFDLVLTSANGIPAKPAPDMYLSAADQLGLRPSECVVFEDSEAGLLSAFRASITSIHVRAKSAVKCENSGVPHAVCVSNLDDALAEFDQLLQNHGVGPA